MQKAREALEEALVRLEKDLGENSDTLLDTASG